MEPYQSSKAPKLKKCKLQLMFTSRIKTFRIVSIDADMEESKILDSSKLENDIEMKDSDQVNSNSEEKIVTIKQKSTKSKLKEEPADLTNKKSDDTSTLTENLHLMHTSINLVKLDKLDKSDNQLKLESKQSNVESASAHQARVTQVQQPSSMNGVESQKENLSGWFTLLHIKNGHF